MNFDLMGSQPLEADMKTVDPLQVESDKIILSSPFCHLTLSYDLRNTVRIADLVKDDARFLHALKDFEKKSAQISPCINLSPRKLESAEEKRPAFMNAVVEVVDGSEQLECFG
jgi:hypothetical protein